MAPGKYTASENSMHCIKESSSPWSTCLASSAMELNEHTIHNATEYSLTDWGHSIELQESKDPNRQRSPDDSSLVSKVGLLVSEGPPISNWRPRSSEESSEPLRSLESTNLASLIPRSSPRRTLPQRSGNVMSDKQLSSPSTVSSVKSPNSRASNGTGDEPYVNVQKQPPKYVYSNESFEVTLQLETPKTGSPAQSSFGANGIDLVASLHHGQTGKECGPEALLITQPSRIVLTPGEDGVYRCSVVCMIRMDSIRRDQGASLAVKFQPRPDAMPPIRSISGASTNPIHLVNYKIRLTLEDDWGPVWYKDEGGRDKSMEIYAAIYDKDGQLRTGEQIPLHPTLCYEAPGDQPILCSNQEILRTLGTSKIVIDKDSGRARIRFRVEDVSKNHQAQDFVLQVGPDPKAKGFMDVAPDFTPAVNVRSKRNKRSRNPAGQSRTSSDQSRRNSPTAMRNRPYDDQDSAVFDPADVPRLRDALKSVINWADEVVNGLYPLQWQVLGYAQHPDGATDYARPYHNMPNPNPCINRVLGIYSETVRDSLRVLLDSVERASPRSDDPSYMMPVPIAAPPPLGEDPMYANMMMSRSPPPSHMPPHAGMPGVDRRGGMHGGPPDSYRSHPGESMYHGRSNMPPPHVMMPPHPSQQHQGMPPMHGYMRPPDDYMHTMPRGDMPPMGGDVPMQRSIRGGPVVDEETRETEVEYVLAKQYKALRTGERLGFPAYSGNKEILGFYREQAGSGVRVFSPISRHRHDFGPLEILQATEILEEAIKKKSDAVHSLKEWGSIDNLLNSALVYDWRQDIDD